MSNNTTLFGGKDVPVTFADGKTDTARARQLPLRDYEAAAKLQRDEFGFTAFCTADPSTPNCSNWVRDAVLNDHLRQNPEAKHIIVNHVKAQMHKISTHP